MSCFQTEAELVARLDGRLDTAGELRVLAHLESCTACRARAETWDALVPVLRRLAPPAPSPLAARRMEVEIERQLAAAPPRPSPAARGLFWGVAGLVAAAVIVVVAMPPRSPDLVAEVTAIDGEARAYPALPGVGGYIDTNQLLVVDARGALGLAVAGAKVKVAGPATLTLAGTRERVELWLSKGTLTASVAHRAAGETFAVVTGDGRVEVRGTRFVVSAGTDGTSVSVEEGRVAVFARGGARRDVSAGEKVSLGSAGFVAETPPAAPPAEPASVPSETGEPAARPCLAAVASCEASARQARGAMRARQPARAVRTVEAAMAEAEACDDGTPAAMSCRDELRYLRAEALREDGRLDAAVAAYRALDRRSAPAAMRQNALYAAAGLEQRLGRPAAARADFERAYAAAPGGALGEEALLGALDSAAAEGPVPAAAAAARRYLEAFPAGRGAPRARTLLGAVR